MARKTDMQKRGDSKPRASDRVRPGTGQGWTSSWGFDRPSITREQYSERRFGTTLRYAVTPGNIAKGNTYKEGPSKGKGKIASSTVHSGGKHSMRHKYQAKMSADMQSAYGARNSIGGSRDKSAWGTHDVSTNNPYGY